jgi:hypothetical protein
MKIYCFGNPLFSKDNTILTNLPFLQKNFPNIEFIEADPNENLDFEGKTWIMDVVKGIEKMQIISDPKVILKKIYTPHDYDLGFDLVLAEKTGKKREINLIAVPYGLPKEKVKRELHELLRTIN